MSTNIIHARTFLIPLLTFIITIILFYFGNTIFSLMVKIIAVDPTNGWFYTSCNECQIHSSFVLKNFGTPIMVKNSKTNVRKILLTTVIINKLFLTYNNVIYICTYFNPKVKLLIQDTTWKWS